MTKKYLVIVNVNLQYEFEVNTPEDAEVMVENIELPPEYVEDSLELVKTLEVSHD